MANQIAAFFAPYTEEEGVAGVAEHMKNFWEPRMRKQILGLGAEEQGDLDPLVKAALLRLAAA